VAMSPAAAADSRGSPATSPPVRRIVEGEV
jgi:hypothetical protein